MWADGPLAAFDVESTGVDVETARIVTACFARIDGPNVTTRNWLINPGVPIPEEATAVHGITDSIAAERGEKPAAALPEIMAEIEHAWSQDVPVVIMNATYDLTVLDRELTRHCGEGLLTIGPVIDPMVIDRAVDKWRRGRRTLTDLCETYRVRIDGAHDAEFDCLAAARIAWALAKRYPANVGMLTLEQLQQQQKVWRRDWALDFRFYLRRNGKPDDNVSGDWPIRIVA